MRQARDRQRESLSLSDSNPGNSVANIFRHRSSSRRGYELPSLLNDNKVFLIDDTDKAELFSAFFAKHRNTESEPVPFLTPILLQFCLPTLTPPPPLHPHLPQLPEVGAGYNFFWGGRPKAERRDVSVVFAIQNDIVGQPPCRPQGTKDRLVNLRLSLRGDEFVTIISVYAPPMTRPNAARKQFYEDLHALLATVPRVHKLIILGDLSVRVGTDHIAWRAGLGPRGTAGCNDNNLLVLLQACAEHRLLLTNTLFRLFLRKKATCVHPRSRH
ncbi:hypothetical protein SprV_0200761400 [Sparganum proliferum]